MLLPPPPNGGSPNPRRNSPIFEQFDGIPGEIEDAGYMIDNGGSRNQQLGMYNGPNSNINQMRPKDKLADYRNAALVSHCCAASSHAGAHFQPSQPSRPPSRHSKNRSREI